MNQNPEQVARDHIDQQLKSAGWDVQSNKDINLRSKLGVAVREYSTSVGPVDYLLFVDGKPVGAIEAKREEEAHKFSVHERQIEEYTQANLKHLQQQAWPFAYLSTGVLTKFMDQRDPSPRFREVFTFHQPETLYKWVRQSKPLRARMRDDFPALDHTGLRDCQIEAIENLETSFRENRPKALVQMATGSGKTFTAITAVYRLLKHVRANRVLFLVDTKNLGEQAEAEFARYQPQDDNHLFTELYGTTRLQSSYVPSNSQVYISTIQRLYSILKGSELDESAEQENPNETAHLAREPMPVVHNSNVPVEFFDFIVIDECHRSIYNVWKQVLDYFDAFQIGLTATPTGDTFIYFNQNIVSDYGYEKAVLDGVLVPYNVFQIETTITGEGATIEMNEVVEKRERLTRRKFWETLDDDLTYSKRQLDKEVVNFSTPRTIIQAFRKQLPKMFPDRHDQNGQFEVPKTLIFAKSDSHAEDIIAIVREEFSERNEFCKKITYQSPNPKTVLAEFRQAYYPRIAVTVDMIATGTDIRPLEVLLFMRDVRSHTYYEQMKGRGTRTCSLDELQRCGSPSAKYAKDHFVIVDAIGVEASLKTDSRTLEYAPNVSLKDLLQSVAVGNRSEETLSSLAGRLLRMDKQIGPEEKRQFADLAGGKSITQVASQLLRAHDPDVHEAIEQEVQSEMLGAAPLDIEAAIENRKNELYEQAVSVFHQPDLRNFVLDVRKKLDQVIDTHNLDSIRSMGWLSDQKADDEGLIQGFRNWVETRRDEVLALQIFYDQPYRRRELTYQLLKDLAAKLAQEQPTLALGKLWDAYARQDQVQEQRSGKDLVTLVSLIRRVLEIDAKITPYSKTVDKNFQTWLFKKQAGSLKFNKAQMDWLNLIKEHIANSVHLAPDDLDLVPFDAQGGRGKMWQLFGAEMDTIIAELNEALAA